MNATSGIDKMNEKQQKELLAKLLEKENKAKERGLKLRVKATLYAEKAKQAGIKVSDEEIDEYISKMK